MWPTRCQRAGLENLIEVEVTAFYYNAQFVMEMRRVVETANIKVQVFFLFDFRFGNTIYVIDATNF